MTIKNLALEFLFMAFWLTMGFLMGMPKPSDQDLLNTGKAAIAQCQKDLPRSQVCELTARVKEGKE